MSAIFFLVWDLARKQMGACLKMSNYGDWIMDLQAAVSNLSDIKMHFLWKHMTDD